MCKILVQNSVLVVWFSCREILIKGSDTCAMIGLYYLWVRPGIDKCESV
uniref:Uncharacterized protein n=1 Tax=Anguilla anguilla TaxID=7936 RepID=A0A0E9XD94_ANGAN